MKKHLERLFRHLALHGAHHRGQIAALLRGLELPVPATDFVVFRRLFPVGGGSLPFDFPG